MLGILGMAERDTISGQEEDSLYLLDYALCGFSVPEGDGTFASRGLKGSINLGKKGILADKTVCAKTECYGALGIVPQSETGDAKIACLLLDTSGIGDDNA